MAVMMGAAHRGNKEKWKADSDPIFHLSHSCTRMTAYKKVSPGTTVEVANENILPVDGFGTSKVDLDQSSNTTKLVRMGAVAYVPGL